MNNLVNPNILELMPYKSGKPIEEIKRKYNLKKVIKLASNENPFQIPDNVKNAIVEDLGNITTYPDSDSFYLRRAIAEKNGINLENVLIGAGSVEIIKMIVIAFLKSGEKVLTSEKTFPMYKIAVLEKRGVASFIEAEMDEKFKFSLKNIKNKMNGSVKIVFLTNPNNPTGTILPKGEMAEFVENVPDDVFVVLDNAYEEYVSDKGDYMTGLKYINKKKNVIILKTFSKIYGLAGLRVGYAFGHPETIAMLNRVKAPFNVTRISQNAALESLRSDEFKNRSYDLNIKNRKLLFSQLQELGVDVVPSETNFLMFFPKIDIGNLNVRLLEEGVIIRPLRGFGVPNAMRVTVGSEEDNNFFVDKLKTILSE